MFFQKRTGTGVHGLDGTIALKIVMGVELEADIVINHHPL